MIGTVEEMTRFPRVRSAIRAAGRAGDWSLSSAVILCDSQAFTLLEGGGFSPKRPLSRLKPDFLSRPETRERVYSLVHVS